MFLHIDRLFTLKSDQLDCEPREPAATPEQLAQSEDLFPEVTAPKSLSYADMPSCLAELVGISLQAATETEAESITTEGSHNARRRDDLKMVAVGLAVTTLTSLGIYHVVHAASERDAAQLVELQEQLTACTEGISLELQGTAAGEQLRQNCVQDQLTQGE